MILRSPQITVGETQFTNVMANLIDERQIRFKVTVDGEPYDFYIRNWVSEFKGLNLMLAFNGLEVPSKLSVQIKVKVDLLKKGVTITGKFLGKTVDIRTTFGQIFQEFVNLLHK